ncbi:MAG: hypothetical protein WDW38_007002 [Sanguina aurantia]
MFRIAAGGLQKLGGAALGNSVAELIKNVNSSKFSLAALPLIKSSTVAPFYPAAAAVGYSMQTKLLFLAVSGLTLSNLNKQARAPEWIVDLSLNVLQMAWWISFASFLPMRGILLAVRSMAPHTASPIAGMRAAVNLKAL